MANAVVSGKNIFTIILLINFIINFFIGFTLGLGDILVW